MLGLDTVNTFVGRDWRLTIDDNWPRFLDTWRPILAHAAQAGVRVGIENCPMFFTKDEWPGGKNLMTAPVILPPLRAAGFDLVWFGVMMTIVMEMGLIHPPVGLNIFVLNRIAPDIGLGAIIWGTLPFVGLMALAVVILSVFPWIAMWLPTFVYG